MFNIIAQAAPAAGPGGDGSFLLIIMIIFFIFMYFMSIKPQQKRMKQHRAMLEAITRGDTIVTNGGLIGKVKKVADDELTVTFGGQDMKVVRTMIADVRNRTAPANDTGKASAKAKK